MPSTALDATGGPSFRPADRAGDPIHETPCPDPSAATMFATADLGLLEVGLPNYMRWKLLNP